MNEFDWSPFESGAAVAFNEVGDSVTGIVRKIAVKQGRSGDVPVVTIIDEAGEEREIWCGAAVLRSEMARCAPQAGDKVRVTLTGQQNVGQPSPMKVFEVRIKHGEHVPEPEADDDLSAPF